MKKTFLSLTFFFGLFLVGHAQAMEAASTYSYFCIGVENEVEGEKIFVKTLYVPGGEILETTHKEGDEIEFGKTFTVKLKVKDRPGVGCLNYVKELEELGLLGNVVVGNTANYIFIPYNQKGHPDIYKGPRGAADEEKLIKSSSYAQLKNKGSYSDLQIRLVNG